MNPELPLPAASLSYWHRNTRSFPHLNANAHNNVPSSVRYLIIGSGISGALTAWQLIQNGVSGQDILILEAREAVSGATGRNAGHVRPDAFRGFPAFAALHGPEQAKKIIANEKEVLENVRQFVTTNNVPCDFRFTTTFEVCLTPEFAAQQAKSMEAFKAAGGNASHVKFHEGQTARELTRLPGAVCAYEWPAASNHPGKLTQWILSDAIQRGVRLWTHCPATKMEKNNGKGFRWNVKTPRGTISADTIIHCTNANAGVLLPELAHLVSARQGQVHAFVPTDTFSGDKFAHNTMSLRYGVHNYFSFNQLRDGTILLGGSGIRRPEDLTPSEHKARLSFNDSGYNETTAKSSSREFLELCSPSSNASDPIRRGEGLKYAWTGTIAVTPDRVPFVGPLEGLDGQWICAGFNGHGMARIFTCVPGLVKLMAGEPWEATGLPECFQISQDRINRLTRDIKSRL